MNKLFHSLSVSALLLAVTLSSCSKKEEPNQVNEESQAEFRDEIHLGKISIAPTPGLRGTTESTDSQKVTFYNVRGEEGLSVYLNENGDLFSCDVDKDGSTDFFIKSTVVSENKTQATYYSKDKKPLQTVLITTDGNTSTIDVIKIYPNSEARAFWGGGKESWGQCFSRRMGSPHGIIMSIASAYVPGGGGPVAVAIGGALSCVLYNPF